MIESIDPNPYRIGSMLLAGRLAAKVTLREAAANLGTTAVEYGTWERGVARPPAWILRRLESLYETRLARRLNPEPQVTLRPLTDVDAAHDAWGATCGPGALAAALGRTSVDSLRDAFHPFKGYTDVATMRTAIDRAGGRILRQWTKPAKEDVLRGQDGARLIVILRWHVPGLPPRAAARHRHAIAFVRGFVGDAGPGWIGDVNVAETWSPARWWAARVPEGLAPERWDGETVIDWAAEVAP